MQPKNLFYKYLKILQCIQKLMTPCIKAAKKSLQGMKKLISIKKLQGKAFKKFKHLNKIIKFCAFNGTKIARYHKLQGTKDPMQLVRKNIMYTRALIL